MIRRILRSFWSRFNDKLADSINSDVRICENTAGFLPKLYIESAQPANLVFSQVVNAIKLKKDNDVCQYIIQGFKFNSAVLTSVYVRIVKDDAIIDDKDKNLKQFIEYLANFVDEAKVLQTNVAYILPDGTNYGRPLFGPNYTSGTGSGDTKCADIVFYGIPGVEYDENSKSIVLTPDVTVTGAAHDAITFVRRDKPLPPAKNFCYLAVMDQRHRGVGGILFKDIKEAKITLTFTHHINKNPDVIKKGRIIGPIPPGALGAGLR